MEKPHESVSAIYPGSFDPLTNGHLDVISRGARLFDRLTVSVLRNSSKQPLFSVDERVAMLRDVVRHLPNVQIDCFEGLLVRYATEKNAQVIIRGIRAVSDYEYELQMALMNRRLEPGIETVFLMAGEAFSFISSRLVKEVYHLGGDVSALVPAAVETCLRQIKPTYAQDHQ
jgi:pantetheine-phosphate adenylyltransferase